MSKADELKGPTMTTKKAKPKNCFIVRPDAGTPAEMDPNELRLKMIARWESAERPLFKGALISDDGCCCAQGDVLRFCGVKDEALRDYGTYKADTDVAKKLGISAAHSVLLRQQNDSKSGSPQDVLDLEHGGIQRVLGPHANLVLAFWAHLDRMDSAAWSAAWSAAGSAAWYAARDAAGAAAGSAARDAAGAAAGSAAWYAAGAAARDAAGAAAWYAAGATYELQGWSGLKSKPHFLAFFGLADPDAWVAAIDPTAVRGSSSDGGEG